MILRLASFYHFLVVSFWSCTCYIVAPEDTAVGLVCPNNHVVSSLVHLVFDNLYLEIANYANLPFSFLFTFPLDHHYVSHIDANSFRLVLHVVPLTKGCHIFPLPSSTSCIFTYFDILLSFSLTKIFFLILYHVPVNHLCVSAKYHVVWS